MSETFIAPEQLIAVVDPTADDVPVSPGDAPNRAVRVNVVASIATQISGAVAATLTPATQAVTATGASGSAVTLTIPAAGVGLFHFITRLQITASTAIVPLAANASAIVTSTNLPGSPAWDMHILRNGGGKDTEEMPRIAPLRSSVANAATTIVAPATTSAIWRLNAEYYTGV